jgi:competence ComEA-like helix-hairpin-helix protein
VFDWTPEERRGALLLVALLLLGVAWDLWRAAHPVAPLEDLPAARAGGPASNPPAGARGAANVPAARRSGPAGDSTGSIDLNRASEAELDALPGIGPVIAKRIVEHRERSGPFRRIEELRAVRGVGPRLLEKIAMRLRIDPAGEKRVVGELRSRTTSSEATANAAALARDTVRAR